MSTAPTLPPSQAIINDKDALLHVQQELRSIVLFVRFRFHRIFWLLRTFNTDMYIGQLLVIRHTILDVVYEVKCIRHRWNQLQSQQLRIQGFLLHTNGLPSSSQRLTQLQQSSARHMSDSLLNLRPQLEHLSRLMSVLLAQLQLANNVSIQQLPPHQNQGLKAPVPPLLIGPGNVIPFQAQVEKSGSLVT